jgi:hypothetical protein
MFFESSNSTVGVDRGAFCAFTILGSSGVVIGDAVWAAEPVEEEPHPQKVAVATNNIETNAHTSLNVELDRGISIPCDLDDVAYDGGAVLDA